MNQVVAEKFRELIGGADSKVLVVPTAMADSELSLNSARTGTKVRESSWDCATTRYSTP